MNHRFYRWRRKRHHRNQHRKSFLLKSVCLIRHGSWWLCTSNSLFHLFKSYVMQLQLYGKKIWIYRSAIDFRCSIDGLIHLVLNELKQNLKEGVYLFFNHDQDKIRGLSWHKNGFCQPTSNFDPQTASKIGPQIHITLSVFFTLLFSVFKAITFVSGLNNRSMIRQSVWHSCGHFCITKYFWPFTKI